MFPYEIRDRSRLFEDATLRTTDLSSKVNLPAAVDLNASCGANMVTLPADIRGNEMFEVRRVARAYHKESVNKVVLQKSIPTQIRQPILYHYQYKKQVDGFMRELTFAERL